MIGVQKQSKAEFLTQASHHCGNRTVTDELALTLRHPDDGGNVQFQCAGEDGLQSDEVANIEVADRHMVFLDLVKHITHRNITASFHHNTPARHGADNFHLRIGELDLAPKWVSDLRSHSSLGRDAARLR
nr:hypothetical protein [Bradyrhizobium cenepequi]